MVVGEGQYASALGVVLGAAPLPVNHFRRPPAHGVDEWSDPAWPQELTHVLLVLGDDASVGDALDAHADVWRWVERCSPHGEHFDLAFVFVLAAEAGEAYVSALSAGLCIPAAELGRQGHGIASRQGLLAELLELAAAINLNDLAKIRARYVADRRRAALGELRAAVNQGRIAAVADTARRVMKAFGMRPGEPGHGIDSFCRPPGHSNGRRLREWLEAIVTSPVTRDMCDGGRARLSEWLKDLEA